MDWLKRNWVDVLMGGLILAIAAGVLVVLLRGGLFVSSSTGSSTATVGNATTDSTTTVTAGSNTTITSPPSTQTSVTPPTPQPDPAPVQAAPVQTTPPAPQSKPVTPRATANLTVPEIPDAPNTSTAGTAAPSSTPNSKPQPTQSQPSAQTTKPLQTTQVTKPTTQTSPSQAGSYSRADFLRNYRIAAGSYTNLERAVRAASGLRARGLPAQHFSSGNTYVVVVGPYAREASARSALTRVRQTLPDAILYRPDGSREGVAKKPTPSQQKQGGGGSSPVTVNAVAYLQVGAFKDSSSASGLLEKLRGAGFAPLTKNISGLLRVLVGPLQQNQIESTRTILKNQGFDAFPINL
jgi:cell division septation protein DedD